jgi:8-oxo-dGTP pyrophosphatase MutT (NUDIX family)
MNIKDKIFSKSEGIEYQVEYSDLDDFSDLPLIYCKQVYGICFLGDKIIIARNMNRGTWSLPGGTVEKDETIEQTLKREIEEETNTKIIKWLPIGYQKVTHPNESYIYQLRCICSVEKIGDFVSDPAGHVSEIKIIDPLDYSKYFDWGDIGERIIQRGLELKKILQ